MRYLLSKQKLPSLCLLAMWGCTSSGDNSNGVQTPEGTDTLRRGGTEETAPVQGQSGSETGDDEFRTPVCACLGPHLEDESNQVAVRGTLVSAQQGCALLEVAEVLADVENVESGDVIGGLLVPLCGTEEWPTFEEGEEVLAVYRPKRINFSQCDSYRACEQQCEASMDPVQPPSTAPPGAANPPAAPPFAGLPGTTPVRECESQCAEETREECGPPEHEVRLGGELRVMKLDGDLASFFWAGESRTQSIEELSSVSCFMEHDEQMQSYLESQSEPDSASRQPGPNGTSASQRIAASPDSAAAPAPAGAMSTEPAPAGPAPANFVTCPLPGWEQYATSNSAEEERAQAPDAAVTPKSGQ